ncbi:MAG: hypothetical protein V1709_03495 [Planctomycetota bacterium]
MSTNFETSGYASASSVRTTTLQAATSKTLTINAFALGGTVTGPLVLTGAASVSTIFEATTYASTSRLIVGKVSSSSAYVAQFASTGTTSVLFGGSSATLGTCLQMKDQTGDNVYIRVAAAGNAFIVNRISCR